jgi:hypothetical protein
MRRSLCSGQSDTPRTFIDKHGNVTEMDTSKIGKAKAKPVETGAEVSDSSNPPGPLPWEDEEDGDLVLVVRRLPSGIIASKRCVGLVMLRLS